MNLLTKPTHKVETKKVPFNDRLETGGWHWPAFGGGPIWYLYKGMFTKGLWLLVFCLVTCLSALPFIMIYSGARGKGDWTNYRLRKKTKISISNI